MELLDFIFQLGVVFAIYGFLWGIIELIFRILTGTRERTVTEIYIIRGIKYIFLAAVTFVFCFQGDVNNKMALNTQLILGGVVLLLYFLGKLQNNQNRNRMFKVVGTMMPKQAKQMFNYKSEILIIGIAIGVFTMLNFYPQLAYNNISKWFVDSIVDIENTVIIGFIFKVIGFFFLLNIIAKMVTAVGNLLSGNTSGPQNPYDGFNNDNRNDDKFDDYEEIN